MWNKGKVQHRQENLPLPCPHVSLRHDCSWYPAEARTEDHVRGCLHLQGGCLVPITRSPPRATCPRTSLPQYLRCIFLVTPSASPASGSTGKIHGPTSIGTCADGSLRGNPRNPRSLIFSKPMFPRFAFLLSQRRSMRTRRT